MVFFLLFFLLFVCLFVRIGGLGHLGIQFASKMGYKVVAISRGSSKKKRAIELGVSENSLSAYVCSVLNRYTTVQQHFYPAVTIILALL